jgi:hypothetical protein
MKSDEARKILKIKKNASMRDIILGYVLLNPDPKDKNALEAKNQQVKEYINKHLMFDPTRFVSPVSACRSCNGLGVKVSYIQATKQIPCRACGGSGTFTIKCNKCDNGLKNGKTCTSCGGTGIHLKTPCTYCGGAGNVMVRRKVQVHKITTCTSCGGTGLKKRQFESKVLTPNNIKLV